MPPHLLVKPMVATSEYQHITAVSAGWEHLNFAARRLARGEQWNHVTDDNELVLVMLGGVCSVTSSAGTWQQVGRRANVFDGMPYALYLPRRTSFAITAISDGVDLAYGWCVSDEDHPARLITPEDVAIEIRGGANATRQINAIIPPGFDCHRLIVVEVFTPSGNWSSYPPHKHDQHREDDQGNLLEADLDEIYFYKSDRPEGYAYQHVYTSDGRLDELMIARPNDVVLVPEGYHPVVSAPGYTTYYLNFLAGSAQSLANTDDPAYAWVKETWDTAQSNLSVVSLAMEQD